MEDLSLNRITQKEFDKKIKEWELMIKQKIPKYFIMDSITVFFNYYDLEKIRRTLTDDIEYFYGTKEKNIVFATSAGVYPYLNNIVSIRIILAKFFKQNEEDLTPEERKDVEDNKEFANVIQEEEDSDDEDLEEETANANDKNSPGEFAEKEKSTPTPGKDKITQNSKTLGEKSVITKGSKVIGTATPTPTPDNNNMNKLEIIESTDKKEKETSTPTATPTPNYNRI
jgi:hypothetical protein